MKDAEEEEGLPAASLSVLTYIHTPETYILAF